MRTSWVTLGVTHETHNDHIQGDFLSLLNLIILYRYGRKEGALNASELR